MKLTLRDFFWMMVLVAFVVKWRMDLTEQKRALDAKRNALIVEMSQLQERYERDAVAPLQQRLEDLMEENAELRRAAAQRVSASHP